MHLLDHSKVQASAKHYSEELKKAVSVTLVKISQKVGVDPRFEEGFLSQYPKSFNSKHLAFWEEFRARFTRRFSLNIPLELPKRTPKQPQPS